MILETPFFVRPIDFEEKQEKNEPVHLSPENISGNLTLSAKHVAISFREIVETSKNKDLEHILEHKGEEEVIMKTDTILQIIRAEDADEDTVVKKWWPFPLFGGFLAGLIITIIFSKDVSNFFVISSTLAGILGLILGFIGKKFWELRLKKLVKKWAKKILEE